MVFFKALTDLQIFLSPPKDCDLCNLDILTIVGWELRGQTQL